MASTGTDRLGITVGSRPFVLGSSGMSVGGQNGLDGVVGLVWDSDVDGKGDMGCGEQVKGADP